MAALLSNKKWNEDMEKEWKEVIVKNKPELARMIDPRDEFIDQLESLKIFNNRTCRNFKTQNGKYAQVSAILNSLSKRPYDGFLLFCEALIKSDQAHIVNDFFDPKRCQERLAADPVLSEVSTTQADAQPADDDNRRSHENDDVAALRCRWRDLVRDEFPALSTEIDPDNGLIELLVSKNIIVVWMVDTFRARTGRSNRMSAILDHLLVRRPFDDFLKFCDALRENNQSHVVDKYFAPNGQTTPARSESDSSSRQRAVTPRDDRMGVEIHGDWKAVLLNKRTELVERLDASNDFLNHLHSCGVLNEFSFEACMELPDFSRSEFLLDHMKRRPDEDMNRFCDGLMKTNQKDLVTLILDGIEAISIPENAPISETGGGDHCNRTEISGGHHHHPVEETSYQQRAMGYQRAGSIIAQPQDDQEDQNQSVQNQLVQETDPTSTQIQLPLPPPTSANVVVVSQQQREMDKTGPTYIDRVIVSKCTREFYDRHHGNAAYSMSKLNRGACYIINNKYVDGMNARKGTERDGEYLRDLFSQFHFVVEECHDLTAAQIKELVKSISQSPALDDAECLALFILSHGEASDQIYGSDGVKLTENEILLPLTDKYCPRLKGKPKIIFIQACRGVHYETQTDAREDGRTDTDAPEPPILRDFLIGYPAQKDYRSFRNTAYGSWYINAIVQVFKVYACDMDLISMLTKVNAIVTEWTAKTDNQNNPNNTQTPVFNSHLSKQLYFFPGITN